MLILYLGKQSKIIDFLRNNRNMVDVFSEKVPSIYPVYNCIISYGYRYKISKQLLDKVKGKAINLHISYLPWNKGANPNYWSWKDNTPKGVTIHYIDRHFDTGDIILQKRIYFDSSKDLTLRNTYDKLSNEIEDLFIHNWQGIFYLTRQKQQGKGSSHTTKDKITLGVDEPLTKLI